MNTANANAAKSFKSGSENRFEIKHRDAGENLAYWVAIQQSVVQMDGQEHGVPMDLRVTEIFRRENQQWQLIHRHADRLASDHAVR